MYFKIEVMPCTTFKEFLRRVVMIIFLYNLKDLNLIICLSSDISVISSFC